MINVLTRARALASVAAMLAAGRGGAAGAADPPKLDTLRVGKAIVTSFPFSALDVGVDAGIWKTVGLELQISDFKGDAGIQTGFTAGSLDLALGSGPAMAYHSKGVPALAVAAMAGRPLDMALVVAKNGPIKSVNDLRGKRIGVTTIGSLTDWLARQLASKQGWGATGVETLGMGSAETRVSGLKLGQISASVHDTTEAYEIEAQGNGQIVLLFDDIVKDFDTHVIFARDDLIAQHPELVARLLKGWFRTVAYMRSHKDAAVKSIARAMGVDESVVTKSYPANMQMMSTDGVFTPAAIEEVRVSVKDLGIVETPLDPKSMYTARFVPVRI